MSPFGWAFTMTMVDFDTLNFLDAGEVDLELGVYGVMSSQSGSNTGGMGLRRDATVTIVMSLPGKSLRVFSRRIGR